MVELIKYEDNFQGTTYNDEDVNKTYGTTYYYKVYANDGQGLSSGARYGNTTLTEPTASEPANLSSTISGGGGIDTITFTWDAVNDGITTGYAYSYLIDEDINGETYSWVNGTTTDTEVQVMTDSCNQYGIEYVVYFKVKSVSENNDSDDVSTSRETTGVCS